jgi:hypothetical protein
MVLLVYYHNNDNNNNYYYYQYYKTINQPHKSLSLYLYRYGNVLNLAFFPTSHCFKDFHKIKYEK